MLRNENSPIDTNEATLPKQSRFHELLGHVLLPAFLLCLSSLSFFFYDHSGASMSVATLSAYIDADGNRTSLGSRALVSDELTAPIVRIRTGFLGAVRLQAFVSLLTLVFTVLYLPFGTNSKQTRFFVSAVALTLQLFPIVFSPIS